MKKIIFLFLLFSNIALAGDRDWFSGGGGAPLGADEFVFALGIVAVVAVSIFVGLTFINGLLFSLHLRKGAAVFRLLSPVAFILFIISILPPVLLCLLFGYNSDGSYEMFLSQIVLLIVAFLYFYILTMLFGLITKKIYCVLIVKVLLILAVIMIFIKLNVAILLFLCALAALLAHKVYKRKMEKLQNKQERI